MAGCASAARALVSLNTGAGLPCRLAHTCGRAAAAWEQGGGLEQSQGRRVRRRPLRAQGGAARCEDVPRVAEGQEVNIRDDALASKPAPKAPKGVTFPAVEPEGRALRFGFVENAERWNSRAAMVRPCQPRPPDLLAWADGMQTSSSG